MNKKQLHLFLKILLKTSFDIEHQYDKNLSEIISDESLSKSDRADKYLDFIVDKVIETLPSDITITSYD